MNFKNLKTFEDCCKLRGYDPANLPVVDHLSAKFRDWLTATYMAGVIVEAINTDETGKVWEPNWNDSNEIKYTSYHLVEASDDQPGGFAFSRSRYVTWYTLTSAGARLCFDTREKVAHYQKYFEPIILRQQLILKQA